MKTTLETTPKGVILKRNQHLIEDKKNSLNRLQERFQDFLAGMTATGFQFTESEFHSLGYGNAANLEDFTRRKTLDANPTYQQGAKLEYRLSSIEVKPFTELKEAHSAIAKLPEKDRREIYSFSIDKEKGQLQISAKALAEIEDEHTTYGNADAVRTIEQLEPAIEAFNTIKQELGFSALEHMQALFVTDAKTGKISIRLENIPSILDGLKPRKNLWEAANKPEVAN